MATCKGIIDQIDSMDAFLSSQRGLLTDAAIEDSAAAMTTSILSQIQAVPAISMAEATSINDAVKRAASLSEGHSAAVATAVTSRLTSASSSMASRSRTQSMLCPEAYMTAVEWNHIENRELPTTAVANSVAARLVRLRAFKLSEESFARVASLIYAVRDPNASAQTLYTLVVDLKAHIPKKSPYRDAELPWVYPNNADELAEDIKAAAYSDAPAEPREIENFGVVLTKCPRRKTHASLRPQAAQQSALALPTPQPQNSDNSIAGMLSAFVQSLQAGRLGAPSAAEQLAIQFMQPTERHRLPGGDNHGAQPAGQPGLAIMDRTGAAGVGGDKVQADAHRTPTVGLGLVQGEPRNNAKISIHQLAKDGAASTELSCATSTKRRMTTKSSGDKHGFGGTAPSDATLKVLDMMRTAAKKSSSKACIDAGITEGKPTFKRPSTAPSSSPCGAPTPTHKGVMLGCSRCRGAACGCASCRNPDFTGKRFRGTGRK